MRILRFREAQKVHVGKLVGGRCISLTDAVPGFPADIVDLIANWPQWRPVAEAADRPAFDVGSVELLPPIARPGKVLALGLNYADHIAEGNVPMPEHQTWFCKQPTSINGPHQPIELPKISDQVDYEVELVVIIGKGGRHISVEQAPDHVFGYCVGNDVTVRDWQLQTTQWMLAKSFDTHAPIGPWISTSDEIGNPHRLALRCLVNGEVRQQSNTSHLVFNVWKQIAHLSTAMTLEPGDVIFTGTPAGVGAAMKPPCFLRSGDVVRCEIEELGAIENPCIG